MNPRDLRATGEYDRGRALDAALACIAKIQVHCEKASGQGVPPEFLMETIDAFLHIAASGSEERFRELRNEFRREAGLERTP